MIQGSGTRGNVGTYKSESLPNITGSSTGGLATTISGGSTGAFYPTSEVISGGGVQGGSTFGSLSWGIDASRSSTTYQSDAPVQAQALLIMCCIKY